MIQFYEMQLPDLPGSRCLTALNAQLNDTESQVDRQFLGSVDVLHSIARLHCVAAALIYIAKPSWPGRGLIFSHLHNERKMIGLLIGNA